LNSKNLEFFSYISVNKTNLFLYEASEMYDLRFRLPSTTEFPYMKYAVPSQDILASPHAVSH